MLKITCPCPKRGRKGMVMSPVNLTDVIAAGGLILQLVDAQGNAVAADPTAAGVLTADDPTEVITAKGDTLHYNVNFPPALASSGKTVTQSALVNINSGPGVAFNSQLPIVCNVSPPPPVAVDLEIILG